MVCSLHRCSTDTKKILVVDDDLLTIATISQTLLRNGYQVFHATDEEHAFKTTKKDKPDLIICNFESTKLDAVQLFRTVRQTPQTRGVPFLFITKTQQMPDEEAGILGPKNNLIRPFTREQLTIAVQENLKRLQPKRK